MNCDKIGKLIYNLRKEKDMTQKQDANISCCGKILESLVAEKTNENHLLNIIDLSDVKYQETELVIPIVATTPSLWYFPIP